MITISARKETMSCYETKNCAISDGMVCCGMARRDEDIKIKLFCNSQVYAISLFSGDHFLH